MNIMEQAGIKMICLYCGGNTTLRLNTGRVEQTVSGTASPINIDVHEGSARIECDGCGYVVTLEGEHMATPHNAVKTQAH
jgi:hypothetical protein